MEDDENNAAATAAADGAKNKGTFMSPEVEALDKEISTLGKRKEKAVELQKKVNLVND